MSTRRPPRRQALLAWAWIAYLVTYVVAALAVATLVVPTGQAALVAVAVWLGVIAAGVTLLVADATLRARERARISSGGGAGQRTFSAVGLH